MKKIIIIAMCAIMLFSATVLPVGAAQVDEEVAQPYWTNTSHISAIMNFVDGVGYADAALNGKFGSTETLIDVVVYRQSGSDWIYVAEEHASAEGMTVGISCEFTPTVGTYYKAEYTFTVYRNGTGEVVARDVYKTYTG
ncbi:MAG: hypothetical protein IJX80_07965 [Clostridia bacterium]|nr:hypothetical protein [Clostridia bacterium]